MDTNQILSLQRDFEERGDGSYGNNPLYILQAANGYTKRGVSTEFSYGIQLKRRADIVDQLGISVFLGMDNRPHFHVINPIGPGVEETLTQVCQHLYRFMDAEENRHLFGGGPTPIYIKKIQPARAEAMIQKGVGFYPIEEFPFHDEFLAEDDTKPEQIVNLETLVTDQWNPKTTNYTNKEGYEEVSGTIYQPWSSDDEKEIFEGLVKEAVAKRNKHGTGTPQYETSRKPLKEYLARFIDPKLTKTIIRDIASFYVWLEENDLELFVRDIPDYYSSNMVAAARLVLDGRSHSMELSTREDYEAFFQVLTTIRDPSLKSNYQGFVAYLKKKGDPNAYQKFPVGFFLAGKIGNHNKGEPNADSMYGLYASITEYGTTEDSWHGRLKRDLGFPENIRIPHGLSEMLYLQMALKLKMERKVTRLNMGGSERDELYNYKAKFNPTENPMKWLVYHPNLEEYKATSSGNGDPHI
ncbi:hypothetical protein HZB01_01400 [Candidatus Woesearchaeota archaeon]|nr:hypothetical protein [Candidatus Woesearchaeota archaeon]